MSLVGYLSSRSIIVASLAWPLGVTDREVRQEEPPEREEHRANDYRKNPEHNERSLM